MKVKSESEVAQSCPTPSDPKDCSPPGSSVHGIFQARVLEWGAIAFSRLVSYRAVVVFVGDKNLRVDLLLHSSCTIITKYLTKSDMGLFS